MRSWVYVYFRSRFLFFMVPCFAGWGLANFTQAHTLTFGKGSSTGHVASGLFRNPHVVFPAPTSSLFNHTSSSPFGFRAEYASLGAAGAGVGPAVGVAGGGLSSLPSAIAPRRMYAHERNN